MERNGKFWQAVRKVRQSFGNLNTDAGTCTTGGGSYYGKKITVEDAWNRSAYF